MSNVDERDESRGKVWIIDPRHVIAIKPLSSRPGYHGPRRWQVRSRCGCAMVSTIVSAADSVMMADDCPDECKRCGRVECMVVEYYPRPAEEVNDG